MTRPPARIEKDIDGDKTTYIYDGCNVIAEYDDTGSLAKKYIHGARVDELVCMIDVADSSAVYYYHYDSLGSVVALSNSSGNSCQSYVYSAYGRVWAEYPDFKANPYMYTGRRFDYETGLYYYRARYYNPYIGRFLQTDPVGYVNGINWYLYCKNNPLVYIDPSGLSVIIATGEFMVLPWRLNPESGLASTIFAKSTGVIIDLVELLEPEYDDIRVDILMKYVEIMNETTGRLTEVPGSDNNAYRAFIETVECSDTDGDGKPDVDENGEWITLNEAAWVEVCGVRHPRDEEYREDGAWYDGIGYVGDGETGGETFAWRAAFLATLHYPNMPEGYIDPGLQGPVYQGSYDPSDWVLDKLTTLEDILESIEDVKKRLEE